MVEYEITGVDTVVCVGVCQFKGFILKGISGCVDPFLNGKLNIPELNLCQDNMEECLIYELKWARSMIGKTLVCDELYFTAYATGGQVSFK